MTSAGFEPAVPVPARERPQTHVSDRAATGISLYVYVYTGCPRRNVPDFGRVFLMLSIPI
jgi:hypothetical protein